MAEEENKGRQRPPSPSPPSSSPLQPVNRPARPRPDRQSVSRASERARLGGATQKKTTKEKDEAARLAPTNVCSLLAPSLSLALGVLVDGRRDGGTTA